MGASAGPEVSNTNFTNADIALAVIAAFMSVIFAILWLSQLGSPPATAKERAREKIKRKKA
jgi:hypothetical protein